MNKYTGIFTRDEEDGLGGAVRRSAFCHNGGRKFLTDAKRNLKEAIHYMLRVEAKLSLKNAKSKARISTVQRSAMKRKEFMKYLRQHDCHVVDEGGGHTAVMNFKNGKNFVP